MQLFSRVGLGRTDFADSSFSIPLDVLLLVLMVIVHLWFNPITSALIVTLTGVYLSLAILSPKMPDEMQESGRSDRFVFLLRLTIVLSIVLAAAIQPIGIGILNRHVQGPATNANDGMIQVEEATQFLLAGKNPYTENYRNTPLADWRGGEPPWTPIPGTLDHNAYLPFLFVLTAPFYLLSVASIGWYDQRFLYLAIYLGLLVLLPALVRRQRDRLALLMALGLNYYFTFLLGDGRNDIVVLFGLVLVTFLLARRMVRASAVALGLTLMTKQTSWFFLPFYLAYIAELPLTARSIRSFFSKTWPLILVVAAVLLPFLVWDARSFLEDTFLFLIGAGSDSYPIRGLGFSTLLVAAGLLPSANSAFPFGIIELLAGIPVLILLLVRKQRQNTLQFVWLGFAIFSLVVEYFSRFFNDNYLLVGLQALVIAAFIIPYRWSESSSTDLPAVETTAQSELTA
ncbi:MAG: hypothetical protein M1482_08640 [Chloroflexi bacterium]|nr:hypothetical protein [Chloroflexota bacterium]